MEIVLEGPSKNALGTTLLTSLRNQLEAAGDEPVLVSGAGDAFSAGLDLKEVLSLDHDTMATFLSLLQEVVFRLFAHPAPTVACVNGHAIAGGAILARVCDFTVATSSDRAKIGLNEVANGLVVPPRVLDMMKHRVPAQHHRAVMLGATLFSPAEAARVGLVDEVVDDPMAAARARLTSISAHPRDAYAATKAALQGTVGHPDPAEDQRFVEQAVPAWTSPELKARLERFLKR